MCSAARTWSKWRPRTWMSKPPSRALRTLRASCSSGPDSGALMPKQTHGRRLPAALSRPVEHLRPCRSATPRWMRSMSGSSRSTRSMPLREGSPFTGLATVALKEAADHMTSARIHLVMLLVLLTAIGAVYAAIGQISQTVSEDQFLFLRLLTTAQEPLPSFVAFLGFLLPLVAIALGFDAINGEYNRRTMSRILSQPIYRDALLTGKFLGCLLVIAQCLLVLWLLVIGLGILLLGLPPSGEEILRGLAFLLASFVYAGVWLGVAMVFSTIFRSPATSALATLTVWLLFTIFWPMLSPLIAGAVVPVDPFDP